MKTQHSTQQQSNDKKEVYSVRGFRDTLASPVFYPVIVVALVLGITSILGLVQNPLKLKSMVNVIHQKVSPGSNVVNGTLENRLYRVSDDVPLNETSLNNFSTKSNLTNSETADLSSKSVSNNSYALFPLNETDIDSQKMAVDKAIERIAFNYDVTSENFWSDLDSSKLETATEEMLRKQKEAAMIGAPLEIDYQQKNSFELDSNDKSIYALGSDSKI